MSIKSARTQVNKSISEPVARQFDEQQRTQILLTLCIELTLCAPNRLETKGDEDLQDQNHKEILGLLQVLQWRINSLKHAKADMTKEQQSPIQIS